MRIKCVYFLAITLFLSIISCKKPAKQIAGNYAVTVIINDSIEVENTHLIITEESKDHVTIETDFFEESELLIMTKRPFIGRIFLYTGEDTEFEIGSTGSIIGSHSTANGDSYSFYGNRE